MRGVRLTFWYHRHGEVIRAPTWFTWDGAKWVLARASTEVYDVPKPIDPTAPKVGVTTPRRPTKLFKGFPELASYLTDVAYPDGTPLGNVQLSIRTRGPLVVAQLKLAQLGGLRLTVEDTNADDALVALEALLLTEPVPFEPDPYPLDGQLKKKK